MFKYLMQSAILVFLLTNIILSHETSNTVSENETVSKLLKQIEAGQIAYRLTEPYEIKALLGEPLSQKTRPDGGLIVLEYYYPKAVVFFNRLIDKETLPFTFSGLIVNDKEVDIYRNKKMVLRDNKDLKKLDPNIDFNNASLVNCDLRNEVELLKTITFNSRTLWPSKEKLPQEFCPDSLLEKGKTPGLGVRKLHKQGITGKGVGIAIIDQPLLLGHNEYTSRIVRYDRSGMADLEPQMHGALVSSIAVGENIGVAPEAELSFFAIPMWKPDNDYFSNTLNKIMEINKGLPENDKIRIVSISKGGLSKSANFDNWEQILHKAVDSGIFVVTCEDEFLNFGTLQFIEGKDPNDPNSYIAGKYSVKGNPQLLVPSVNMTFASNSDINAYTYNRIDGLSTCASYIAGLAALAYQIDKNLKPKQIVNFLVESAVVTSAGPVINPVGFIERVKKNK